jgi:hypothetical protein
LLSNAIAYESSKASGQPLRAGRSAWNSCCWPHCFHLRAAGRKGLFILKKQHDRQAHLAATESVLEEGVSLLDALCDSGIASSTNSTPDLWRQFSAAADNVFAVRKDVQSISIVRDGVTVFHRQSCSLTGGDTTSSNHPSAKTEETELSQRTLEICGAKQPVFVVSRSRGFLTAAGS